MNTGARIKHDDRQRIDRWLWHARLVRTRPSAATLAESGYVRLNGQRVTASSRAVKVGDILTVALPGKVRIFKVEALMDRRSSAPDARRLYQDLTPPPAARGPEVPPLGRREPGSGRPTKRERRALERDRFLGKRSLP
jgi:ribosome-associated heat shock protein Hsp15